VTSGIVLGEDILIYGMSRQQIIFIFKFDPSQQKYIFLARSYEAPSDNKKV